MYHGDRGDADGLEAVGAPGGMGPDGREMLERRFWRRPFFGGEKDSRRRLVCWKCIHPFTLWTDRTITHLLPSLWRREVLFCANRPINWNLKTIKLWVIIALHRLSIKSSKSLENKGFIAMCSPYPFIWFHTSLLFPCLLIRAKSRARKSHNKI